MSASYDHPSPTSLSPEDLVGFALLLRAQDALGAARTVDQQAFLAFFEVVDQLGYDTYRHIDDARVKAWVDLLYPPIVNTRTCYGPSTAGMYCLYVYSQFTAASFTEASYEPANTRIADDWERRGGEFGYTGKAGIPNATPWNWFGTQGTGFWRMPPAPQLLFDALGPALERFNEGLASAGGATSAVELFTGTDPIGHADTPAELVAFQHARFDPANWTDSDVFLTTIRDGGLWQQQRDAAGTLLTPASLTRDDYVFLAHLLVALLTGDAAARRLALRVLTAVASSPGYPNDTFANQLVYLLLLHWSDPLGDHAWTTAQLEAELTLLSRAVSGADPGSVAIRDSLRRHLKVLQVDTAYPLQDPYCPAIGFSQRITDTLFALDKARSTLGT